VSSIQREDRATAVLFGDGAGTVLIEPVEDESVGILDYVCHMNGDDVRPAASRLPLRAGSIDLRCCPCDTTVGSG